MSETSSPLDCAEARRLLGLRQDGELGPLEALRLEKHVSGCDACSREANALAAISAAMRDPGLVFSPPAGFDVSVPRSPRRAWRVALPIAASFVAGSLLTLAAVFSDRARNPVAREIVAAQIRASFPGHLTDVLSSDRHTVKPWFSGKIPFSPPVVDLSVEGFPLEGGRLDYVAGRTVAVLVYRRRQHLIGVYVWPSDRESPGPAPDENGFHVLRRTSAGMTWWIVSDVDLADLRHFADLLREKTAG